MKLISPKQFAGAIGVSEASIKRWCDQGRIRFEKTPGGHRKLAIRDVLAFLREQKIEALRPESLGLPSLTGRGTLTLERASNASRDALLRGDRESFERIIFTLFTRGESVISIGDQVIARAFHEIGNGWECGEVEVYQERLGYEICREVLAGIRTKIPTPAPSAPIAIGGSVSGDHYELPTTLVELTLLEAGWNTKSLGSNLPFESLEKALDKFSPKLLWISVSHIANQEEFVEGYERLYQKACKNGAVVAVGGQALTPDVRKRIHYTSCNYSLKDFAEFARPFARKTNADL